jgi:hypothetical protein
MAGMTLAVPMLAVLRMPQRSLGETADGGFASFSDIQGVNVSDGGGGVNGGGPGRGSRVPWVPRFWFGVPRTLAQCGRCVPGFRFKGSGFGFSGFRGARFGRVAGQVVPGARCVVRRASAECLVVSAACGVSVLAGVRWRTGVWIRPTVSEATAAAPNRRGRGRPRAVPFTAHRASPSAQDARRGAAVCRLVEPEAVSEPRSAAGRRKRDTGHQTA